MKNKLFQIQLKNAEPITAEDYSQMEETSFYLDDKKVTLNLKHKYFFSGRRKNVGDIVLLAVLASFKEGTSTGVEFILQTITLHPDEAETLYEEYEVQPTHNTTLLPVMTFKKEHPEKTSLEEILIKITNSGIGSLTSEELELFKKSSLN